MLLSGNPQQQDVLAERSPHDHQQLNNSTLVNTEVLFVGVTNGRRQER